MMQNIMTVVALNRGVASIRETDDEAAHTFPDAFEIERDRNGKRNHIAVLPGDALTMKMMIRQTVLALFVWLHDYVEESERDRWPLLCTKNRRWSTCREHKLKTRQRRSCEN